MPGSHGCKNNRTGDPPMKILNWPLYARVLRLDTDHDQHCRQRAIQSHQDPDGLRNVVRDFIAADLTKLGLVWC
jgi:hypothetical protein